jgi:hypothetical protein
VIFKKPLSPVLLKKLLLKQCRPDSNVAELSGEIGVIDTNNQKPGTDAP